MGFLDKVGKLAMDGLEKASLAAGKVQKRVDPMIERSELATKLRDKIAPKVEEEDDRLPFPNASPFVIPEQTQVEEVPLANPELAAQIFGRGNDPWTGRARQLLRDYQCECEFVDLGADDGVAIETKLIGETGQQSPPYVFLRGELIGGYNALNEVVRLGQLEEMIKSPEERKAVGGVRIKISKRDADDLPPGAR